MKTVLHIILHIILCAVIVGITLNSAGVAGRICLDTDGVAGRFGLDTAGAADVELTLRPEQELNRIDEKIYSHFLEHIYHSINGGLWGELVWNRSFEDNDGGGWSLEANAAENGGEIIQKSLGDDQRFVFGDANWSDYELTLEAQKTGGAEGFLVLFRVQNDKVFSWANLGGWQNKQHGVERRSEQQNRQGVVGPMPNGSIETGKWYSIKIRCEGDNVKVSLDGKQMSKSLFVKGRPVDG